MSFGVFIGFWPKERVIGCADILQVQIKRRLSSGFAVSFIYFFSSSYLFYWVGFFAQSWRKSGVSLKRPFLYLSVCSTDPIGSEGTCSESQMPLWPLETGTRLGQITSPMFLMQRRVRWNTRSLRPKWMARRELWSPISSLLLFTALIFTAATMKLTRLVVALPTLSLQEPCLQVRSHKYKALFYLLRRDQSRGGQALWNQLEKHWRIIKKFYARK